ncbi:MAG: hypothetical protein ACI89W_000654 [Gammaproteobacteria bacterium]
MNRFATILFLLSLSYVSYGQGIAERGNLVADNIVESRFDEGEELIMTVQIDKFVFGELFAIKKDDSVHVEFEGLLAALDFPIYYDEEFGRYNGWFIKPANTFSLSYSHSANSPVIYDPDAAEQLLSLKDFTILDGSLFISLKRLNDWFGLGATADFRDLMLYLTPKQPLPFQQKLDRKKQRIRNGRTNEVQYTRLSRGFGLLSPQAIDLQVNSLYSNDREELNGSYSLLGSRDVALFNAKFFLNGNSNNWLNTGRLQLSKSDEENSLFGINNLANFKVGDITPVRQTNGATLAQSRGILVDNLASSNDINLDATSVSGEIQSGWDVELYRNGVLLGQQFEVQTGRFEFNDIPLYAGLNQLRVVLYGPQGQMVERIEQRLLDRDAVSTARLKYQVSLSQNNKSLFGLEDSNSINNEDFSYNLSGNVQYNIFGNTALNAGLSSQFGGDNALTLATISTNTAVANRLILGTNFQADDQENYQARISARGALWKQNLSFALTYGSLQAIDENEKRQKIVSEIDMSGQFSVGEGVSLSYRNDLTLSSFEEGNRYEFRNSLGLSSRFIDVFNNITYINPTSGEELRFGSLSFQKPIGPVLTRLNAAYSFEENLDFNDIRFDVSWFPFENISSKFTYNRNIQNKTDAYGLQTTWKHRAFSITGVLKHSDALGFSAGVNAQLSLGGAPIQYNSVFNSINPVVTKSSLLVRVFIDKNVNGYYELGERLLPDVKVLSVQSRRNALTNAQGIASLTNLPDGRLTDITLDFTTVDDPFLVPLIEGVAIKTRAGYVDNLDFPLAIGNEIEGVVYTINDKDVQTPLSRTSLELLDSNGVVKYQVETEFDGYYLIMGVTAGTYVLRVKSSYLDKMRLKTPSPLSIKISNDTGLISGTDIYVEQKEFAQGYVPAIASFSSEKMANLFWSKAKHQSFIAVFKKSAFTVEKNQKTLIGLGLFESLDIAQQVCESIQQKYDDCQVIPHAIEINHLPSKTVADNRKRG